MISHILSGEDVPNGLLHLPAGVVSATTAAATAVHVCVGGEDDF